MNNVKKSISKERNLKHVKVYDHLYSMIKDGAFPGSLTHIQFIITRKHDECFIFLSILCFSVARYI